MLAHQRLLRNRTVRFTPKMFLYLRRPATGKREAGTKTRRNLPKRPARQPSKIQKWTNRSTPRHASSLVRRRTSTSWTPRSLATSAATLIIRALPMFLSRTASSTPTISVSHGSHFLLSATFLLDKSSVGIMLILSTRWRERRFTANVAPRPAEEGFCKTKFLNLFYCKKTLLSFSVI